MAGLDADTCLPVKEGDSHVVPGAMELHQAEKANEGSQVVP